MVEPLIASEAEGKTLMHATCKDALKAININCDNCPIIL